MTAAWEKLGPRCLSPWGASVRLLSTYESARASAPPPRQKCGLGATRRSSHKADCSARQREIDLNQEAGIAQIEARRMGEAGPQSRGRFAPECLPAVGERVLRRRGGVRKQ